MQFLQKLIIFLLIFISHMHAGNFDLKKMSKAIYESNLTDVKIFIHSKQVSVKDVIPCHALTGGNAISHDSLLGRAVEIYNLKRENALKGYISAQEERDSLDIILFLLKMKAPLNMRSEQEYLAPLHIAAMENMPNVATWLLDAGADINLPGGCRQHRTLENVLAKKKPEITMLQETPLYFATQFNHPEMVKILLDRGASIEISNTCGLTPYNLTTSHGSSKNDFLSLRYVEVIRHDIKPRVIHEGWGTIYMSNKVTQPIALTTQDRAEVKKVFDNYFSLSNGLQSVRATENKKPNESSQNLRFSFQ